jgi:AraC family transcriptional regulator of adaptative response/methylated-DNA-[protein]-cysteine methyltransferase
MDNSNRDYERVRQALEFVAAHYREQPDLARIAAHVHLSPYHFQRLFSRWAGTTPKRFLQHLTIEHAKASLLDDMSVLEASLEHGLEAPARLSELFVRIEAITPGEFRRQGQGLVIRYGFHDTPFGGCLLGTTERGICALSFVEDESDDQALAQMQARLPRADYRLEQGVSEQACQSLFASESKKQTVLHVPGTAFQLKVWQALLRIPPGRLASYGQIAQAIGKPSAARAVGTAIGRNPVAIAIPCHRVIRENGMLGGYHWGEGRKLSILGREALATPIREAS